MNDDTPKTNAAQWTETNQANSVVKADFARELERENARLRNQIENLLKPSRTKIAEQRDQLREALEFISETGGTTHETECGTITCTGFWCAEQARSALSALPNDKDQGCPQNT